MNRRRLFALLIAVVTVFGVGLMGASGATAKKKPKPPQAPTISVQLTATYDVASTSPDLADRFCEDGVMNDSGIGVGDPIKVLDGSGAIVGLGSLTSSAAVPRDAVEPGQIAIYDCVYAGKVKVKKTDFYTIEIAGRSGVSYSYAELVKSKWKAFLAT